MMRTVGTSILLVCVWWGLTKGEDSCPGLPMCFCSKDKTSVNCDGKHLKSVPDNIPTAATKLFLRYNDIVNITTNTFSRYTSLENIYLGNNKITSMEPMAFAGPPLLSLIDLGNNKLSSIGANVFSQLPDLQELRLMANKLEAIDGHAFDGSESLKYISLQSNAFTAIPPLGKQPRLQKLILQANRITNATFPDAYASSKGLQYIGLSSNVIKTLDNDTFKALGNVSLSSLYLSHNKLTSIESGTFSKMESIISLKLGQNPLNNAALKVALKSLHGKSIVSLDISGLRLNGFLLQDTFKLLENTSITSLDMRFNTIPQLFNGSFTGLDGLLHLQLSDCRITHTDTGAFVGLDKLTILNLENNQLLDVPANLPSTLTSLFLGDNQIQTINPMVFKNLGLLWELRIRYNKIQTLTGDSFQGLVKLSKLNLMNNFIATLPGSVFEPLVRLTSLNIGQNNLFSIQNATKRFTSMGSLVYFNMAGNKCTFIQSDLFKYMRSLKYLYLENNNLGSMIAADFGGEIFQGLGKLEELYLSDNGVTDIRSPAFQDLTSLIKLNLTNNKIKHWSNNLFKTTPRLKYVDLTNNLITVLKKDDLDQLSGLEELNLTGNPFMCGCDSRWFRDWINRTSVQLTNLQSYQCTQPKEWTGRPLLSFNRSKINCVFYTWQEIVIISVGVALLIVLVVTIVYRKRWSIKLYYYKKRATRRIARMRAGDGLGNYGHIEDGGKVFDAYISCADEDKDWVIQHLMFGVDKGQRDDTTKFGGQFSLFFDDRDAEAGHSKVKNIVDYMSKSRKVIVVLSKKYLDDSYHLFEMDEALAAMYNRQIEEIIVVYIERGFPAKRIPRQLADTMRRHNALEWSDNVDAQQLFTQQLVERLTFRADAANIDTD